MSAPRSATILPQSPSCTASIACSPNRVASQRSNAVGVPPRWMWPSTVVRASLPVRSSICCGQPLADAGEPDVAERVERRVPGHQVAVRRAARPRRRRRSARSATRNRFSTHSQTWSMSNGCSGMRMTLAPPAMPGVQRDPAGVPAHHLDDERAVVRLGGGVQAVDRLGRDVDRGVEAEGVVGRVEVVVDGLRHADDADAVLVQSGSRRRGCPRRRSRPARRRRARRGSPRCARRRRRP